MTPASPSAECAHEKQRTSVSYLTVSQVFNLEVACRVLECLPGYGTFHVGSSLERSDYRDVDLRCIMPEIEYKAFIGNDKLRLHFLNTAISDWLSARTGLPIDFQFQNATKANVEFKGRPRNAVGIFLASLETGHD